MNENILKICKKIITNSKKLKIKKALEYVLIDNDKIVATDSRCLFVVTGADQGKRELLGSYNLDASGYPKYERVIPTKYTDGVEVGSDINYVLSTIYKSGVIIDYKYIEILFVSKGLYENLKFYHDKEDMNRAIMIKGELDGYEFIFVLAPIYQ